MLGLSSGLIKGTSVLRSIVKKGLQAWYKADQTQAPLGEEEIANGEFNTGPELVSNGDFSDGLTGWSNPPYNSTGDGFATIEDKGGYARLSNATTPYTLTGVSYEGGSKTVTHDSNANIKVGHFIIGDGLHHSPAGTGGTVANYAYVENVVSDTEFTIQHAPASGVDVNNGTVKVTTDSRSKYLVSGSVAFENGKTYQIKFKVRGKSASTELNLRADHTRSNTTIAQNLSVTTSFVEHTIYTEVTNAYWDSIGFGMADWQPTSEPSESDEWIEIDDVSIKQTNPNDSWTVVNSAVVKDGESTLSGGGARLEQTVLTTGKTYQYSFKAKSPSASGYNLKIDSPLNTNKVEVSNVPVTYTNYSGTFIAGGETVVFKESGTPGVTISDVSIKEITNSVKDFSPNANNGVLYSGKALNFDGSADTIDFGNPGYSMKTVAFWINVADVTSNTEQLMEFQTSNGISSVDGTITTAGTWTGKVTYVDGVAGTSLTAGNWHRVVLTTTAAITVNDFVVGYDDSNYGDFDIADLQIYNKAWTASDVTYDYNNPDKDVFDNSNSSIVTTDCKALYRLNEGAGNRVYNAAPVLGSEMVSNGDFSSVGQELVANGSFATSSGWGNSGGIWSISGGKASVDTTSSTTLTQTVSVVDNKLYNLSFEISDYVKGSFQVEFGGGKPTESVSANGVYNYTVSSPATNVILYLYALNESKFSIDNISIKEIEGDWRALEGSNQYLGWSQTGWSIANGKASVDHNNTDLTTIELSKSSFGQVAGGTYSISFEISDYVSGTFQPQFNGQIIAGVTANGVYNYIVSANNTGGSFYLYALSSPKFSVDNVSVKEITLPESYVQTSWVSGNWITAQPYIPQYAMSSYSKKMIFDGSDDYVALGSETTIAADEAFSFSFWYYNTVESGNQPILGKQNSTSDYLKLNYGDEGLVFRVGSSTAVELDFDSGNELIAGKLSHIVLTSPGGTGTMKCYLNGVVQADTEASPNLPFDYQHVFRSDTDYGEGFIDEFAHFSKELSQAEVQEIFNAGIALDVRDHSCYYGDEVLTNGDFSASGALLSSHQNLGFIEENGLASISNGELSITAASGEVFGSVYATVGNSSLNILEAPGVFYKFTYTITEVSGSQNIEFYSQPGGWTSLTAEQMTVGTHTIILETAGRNFAVRQRTDGSIVKFSSWSVKKIQLNGYWRNNGTDTWYDLSPYGNNGTVNGSPTTIQLQEVPYFKKDTFGLPMNKVRQKGLNFDEDSYVQVTDDSSLGDMDDGFTCSFWYRHAEDVGAGNYFWLVTKGTGHDASVNNGLAISAYDNKIYAHLNTADGQFQSDYSISAASPSAPVWHYVTVTYNGSAATNSNLILYTGETLRESTAVTGDVSTTAEAYPLMIGTNHDNSGNKRARGVIDDVKWYSRALGLNEIKKNYKATKSRHSSTSSWSDDFSDGFI